MYEGLLHALVRLRAKNHLFNFTLTPIYFCWAESGAVLPFFELRAGLFLQPFDFQKGK